ncbi:XdhC family protein [Rubellimicrobium aerolatum]|uniref:XdhC family protein n=1 Tax=Rubellimicrobium aerolatum TaxID=490979 RepID=A0ABW0S9X5_9RHOB|nr:xanthine dehydrogenase accessory factor [Rubellimicrobium aerolatum]
MTLPFPPPREAFDLPSRVAESQAGPDGFASFLEEDMAPVILALDPGEPFALATLHGREGGPRPVGSQMIVTASRTWGFLSGGCVEADLATHARAALADGRARRLTYGRGSPFFDIRLPCGGRLDLLVEPIPAGDPAMARLRALHGHRRALRYLSDGERRRCVEADADAGKGWIVDKAILPPQRLVVIGSDPFALAIAVAGVQQGWGVTLICPVPPPGRPPESLRVATAPPAEVLADLRPDPWTAIAVASHEEEAGLAALVPALLSPAGYVGVLGSRHRLEQRRRRLLGAGLDAAALGRLRGPIGLPIAAQTPREIAVATIAEIVALRPGARA